jgi:hypothetical protein
MSVARRSVSFWLLMAVFGGLLASAPASAGTYDVYACGGPAGAVQRAFAAFADPQMEAYSICPPQSAVGTGIATKATSRGGIAAHGAGAYQVFTAPSGASLESVGFNVGAIRLAAYWSVGLVAFDGDYNSDGDLPYGCYHGGAGCGVGTPTFSIRVAAPLFGHTRFRFETRCFNPAGCDVSASPFSPANRALFSAANVVVRVQDQTVPQVAPHHGALWSADWHRGSEAAWADVADNVGIVRVRLLADGGLAQALDFRDPSWPEWAQCDFTLPKPCKDFHPAGLGLDTGTLADGEHHVRFEAIDTAGNVSAIERRILVDNTPPGKASNVAVEGGEEWRSTNDFTVRWANPAGQVAPIARAHYELCGAGGAACTGGAVAGDAIDGLSRLTVPAPGEYTLRVWLEDAAGNQDPDRASDPVRLRFDDEAPTVVFEHPDVTQPRRVAATLADRGSGIAGAGIEIRPEGGRQWRELDAALEGGTLVAQVDDLALPDGTYELRAHARDRAGNQHTGDQRRDGTRMRLRLPLRAEAGILLSTRGKPRCRHHAGRRKRRCRPRPPAGATIVVKRRSAHVDGLLRTALGTPIAGVRVNVSQQLRTGGAWRPLARLESDGRGRFSLPVSPGPSRSIRFSWDGTPLVKPASGEVRMLAPAASSIAVDRRNVRNGDAVVFKGRLIGADVPAGGKLVDLQAYYRGGWRTFATPRTDSRGRWAYRYRFGATRGVVRYRFRARIPREAAYPYELGYSRRLGVTVRG